MLIFGLLILGLLIFIILLLVFFVVLLLVLFGRWRGLWLCQFPLGDLQVLLGLFSDFWVQFDRLAEMLLGIFQVGVALGIVLLLERPLEQCRPQVVFRFAAQLRVGGTQRVAEFGDGFFVIAQLVFRRSLVEVEVGGIGASLQIVVKLLPGFLVVFAVEKLHAGFRLGVAWRPGGERQQQQQSARAACPVAAFVDEQGERQERDPEAQRPLVAFDGAVRVAGVDLPLLELAQAFVDDAPHVGGAVLQPDVEPAGRLRDLREPFFVQARFHKLPAGVFHKLRAAVLVGNGDERAVRRADPDGEDAHRRRRLDRRVESPGIEVFAVGEEDQGVAFALALAERLGCCADGLGDVCAAQGDHVGVEFSERGKHRRVIDGERRLQEGGPGEGDQSEAVAFQRVGEVLRRELGAFEPIGGHVGRQHGARGVHGEEDVASLALGFLDGVAVARLGQRDEEASQRAEHQREMQTAFAQAHAARQRRLQAGGDEALQQLAAAAFPPGEEPGEHGQKRQRTQPERRAPGDECGRIEAHGSLLFTVCDRPAWTSKSSEPAATNHGKRSRY